MNSATQAMVSARTAVAGSPQTTRAVFRASLIVRWGATAVGLLAVAAIGWRFSRAQVAPPVRYQTSVVDEGAIVAKVTASGALSAIVTVQVGSQVSGRIDHLYVDFNSQVTAGQIIATIEPSFFRAAVEQAQATLVAMHAAVDKATANQTLADRSYSRQKTLFAENLTAHADLDATEDQALASRADVEASRATLLQAQAALRQAQLNLGYTRIVSPIAGIVLSRTIDVGQTVAASFQAPTLFTIARDLTKMQVDTNVAEGDVGRLHAGMDATFTVDAYPSRVFRGTVRQVRDAATVLQNVVTYDAVIDIDNRDMALRPVMTANASFVYGSRDRSARMPNAALRFRPDAQTVIAMTGGVRLPSLPLDTDTRLVWVLRDGVATEHAVHTGIGDGTVTELLDGDVRPGDLVITEAIAPDGGHHGS